MRNLFLFLKTGMLISAFVFFSAIFNFVNAAQHTIEMRANFEHNWGTIWSFTTANIRENTSVSMTVDVYSRADAKLKLSLNENIIYDQFIKDGHSQQTMEVILNPYTTYELKVENHWWAIYRIHLSQNVVDENESPSIDSINYSTWIINRLNHLNDIEFNVKWIKNLELSETVTLLYSNDNIIYETITWSIISSQTWKDITFNKNFYNYEDGIINNYIKVNDWNSDSIITHIEILKETVPNYSIDIIETNDNTWWKKVFFNKTIWDISYNINKEWKCDNSLIYLEYGNEIVLNKGKYNNSYICFKIDTWNVFSYYVLTEKLTWITWIMHTTWWNIFVNYKDWSLNGSPAAHDNTLAFLEMLPTNSLTDINWDGLVDMLYKKVIEYTARRESDGTYYKTNREYFAIMINNWDYTFDPVYRCIEDDGIYYWDCVE